MRFDQLAILGKSIEHEDQIEYILDGLPEEFKPVVDQTESRDTPPTIPELHEKLLNFEAKLHVVSSNEASLPISAHAANTRRSSSFQNRGNHSRNWNNTTHVPQPHHHRQHNTRYDASRQDTQRQDPHNSRGYQGKCQICGIYGHSARRCYQFRNQ